MSNNLDKYKITFDRSNSTRPILSVRHGNKAAALQFSSLVDIQEAIKGIEEILNADRTQSELLSKEEWERQAIKDGWVKVPKEIEETWRELNRIAGFMTGNEWLNRFQVQLDLRILPVWNDGTEHHEIYDHDIIMGYARKASGLS